jgi:4-hydroxy-tetrahydrodipicolinate reductase
MKLTLIGHGAMGKLVANLASAAGDEVGAILTSRDAPQDALQVASVLRGHDVAIDFSAASAVERNVEACARAGVPLVEGTTGWHDKQDEVRRIVAEYDGSLVFGANFSIGVNVFYRIVAHAAKLMTKIDQYAPFIEEEHHSRKRDAPSGTALELKKLMTKYISGDIPIASLRAGHIPGTHCVGFDSPPDQITLTHMARSREGFAVGALLAARWIVGRKGVFEFSEVIDQMLRASSDEVSTPSR